MTTYTDKNYSISLQNSVLPSPIKEIVIEPEKGDLYKAFMILDDGTKIYCNYGCIGSRCYGKTKEEVMNGWKHELEDFWFSRNLPVLVA